MYIESIKLRDFRNYTELEIAPHPGVNLLFGQNGSGKTNLLEAIHYCALGRSHRTSQDREVVRKGQTAAAVGVTVRRKEGRHDVAVKLTPEGPKHKHVFVDKKRASRISDMMGQVQCVIFSPEDLMLVKDGPSARRRFLDMMISQLSTPYFIALQQYQKAMDQRNAMLREVKRGGRMDQTMMDAFEQSMAEQGAVIHRYRKQMIEKLAVLAAEKYRSISGRDGEDFCMTYKDCTGETDFVTEAKRQLAQSRQEDAFRGTTSFGVHREDILLTLMGREMKLFASQGQIRTATLSMKLAQMALFEEISGEMPILLLDDVMSELDMTRRTRLLKEISGGQTFVTCTDESDLEGCDERRTYLVKLQPDGIASVSQTNNGESVDDAEDDEPDFT
jgi:DNA replication and repair protein RecF